MKVILMRVIAVVLCVVIVFGLVALFLRKKDKEDPINTIKTGNSNKTGIKADTVMIEMNESYSATADEYFYHALGLREEYINQYGAQIFDSYPELVDNILKEVDSMLIDNAAYSLWGSEVGFELSEEDLASFEKDVEDLKAYLIEQGTTFKQHIAANNLTEELFREVYIKNMYINKFVNDYLMLEMEKIEVSEEEIDKYIEEHSVLAAKHILLTYEYAEDIEELSKAANEMLRLIVEDGEDFDVVMRNFTMDTGFEENPDGYTFRTGEFVPEFEEVTRELEIGEISGVVESEYGVHIIKRIDINRDSVKSWIQQERMEEKRLSYEQRLDPKTTPERDGLILLDMKSVI